MNRCEVDEDAICLSPLTARRPLRREEFEVLRTDFRFRPLRALGRSLAGALGGQYLVVGRRR